MDDWEKKIRKTIQEDYLKAYKDLEDKFYKNSKKLLEDNIKMREKLANYEITKFDYQQFMLKTQGELHKQVAELADALNSADLMAVDEVNHYLPHAYAESMNHKLYEIEDTYNMNTGLDIVNDKAVEKAVRGKYFRKVDVAKNTAYNRRRLSSAITAGVLRGSSVKEVAKSLLPLVQGNEKSALLNARTWINSAENGGSFEAAEMLDDAGIKMQKTWVSAGDDRVRDSHRELDGEIRNIDEEFSNGGQYPCDPALDAEEYYNCRCTIIEYLAGFQPIMDNRHMDLGGKSYEEWKKGKQKDPEDAFSGYKDFGDNKRASELYHEGKNFSYNKWDKLSDEERGAVRDYTGDGFTDMNKYLRTGDAYYDETPKLVGNCTKALDKMKINEDCVVYRGMGSEKTLEWLLGFDSGDKYYDAHEMFKDKNVLSSMKGMRFVEKGFMSTGINEDAAWGGVQLKLYVPKGTKGMYVDPISAFRGEDELLLQRNTTVEIIKAQRGGGGHGGLEIIGKVVSQKR